jgi:DNA-binding Xre family transcriptional regulator
MMNQINTECAHAHQGSGDCDHCVAARELLRNLVPDQSVTKSVNHMLIGEMAERGMSRSDMSRALGVSRETITIALNDTSRDWKICTLDEWADALNCDLVIKLQARQDEPEPR